jgi:hypothetical protein
MFFRVGIISDTHGLLRPEAERCLAGVDHIIHGGDVGRPDVLVRLRKIAPVTAIRGNVDAGDWANEYPDTECVRLGDRSIYILHDLKTLAIRPRRAGRRRDRFRPLPPGAGRNNRRGVIPQSGQRRATALQTSGHACNAGYNAQRSKARNSSAMRCWFSA